MVKMGNIVFKFFSIIVLVCFIGISLHIENAFARDNALQKPLVTNSTSLGRSAGIVKSQTNNIAAKGRGVGIVHERVSAIKAIVLAGVVFISSFISSCIKAPASQTGLPAKPAPTSSVSLPPTASAALSQRQLAAIKPTVDWVNSNCSQYRLPKSFQASKSALNNCVDESQRMVVSDGMSVYDSALAHILWGLSGDINRADNLTRVLWLGRIGDLRDLRAYYDSSKVDEHPFIYNDPEGNDISSDEQGKRGFVFKIVHAGGKWKFIDSTTGKEVTWNQWQPITGENMWAGIIGPMQVYYKKYGLSLRPDADELQLAKEIARAAMLLQADNGGIRMGPKGIYNEQGPEYYYNTISTENNLSAYAGFKMLYMVTKEEKYLQAMSRIENYLKWAYDPSTGTFAQGASWDGRQWTKNQQFAEDCQAWAILSLGPQTLDSLFGQGATVKMWKSTKGRSGIYENGKLTGVDYSDSKDNLTYEWSAGAVLACRTAGDYYAEKDPAASAEFLKDSESMLSALRRERVSANGGISYPYARNGNRPTGFGWLTPPDGTLSLASAAFMAFAEIGFNPMALGGGIIGQPSVSPAALPDQTQAPAVKPSPTRAPAPSVAPVKIEDLSGSDGHWTDGIGYSCWKTGNFDLSKVKKLRLSFSRNIAGAKFYLRLLPQGHSPGEAIGINSGGPYTIPPSGIIEIDISAQKFGLTDSQLKSLIQISVHSKQRAWDYTLPGNNPEIEFKQMELLSGANFFLIGKNGAIESSTIVSGEGVRILDIGGEVARVHVFANTVDMLAYVENCN